MRDSIDPVTEATGILSCEIRQLAIWFAEDVPADGEAAQQGAGWGWTDRPEAGYEPRGAVLLPAPYH